MDPQVYALTQISTLANMVHLHISARVETTLDAVRPSEVSTTANVPPMEASVNENLIVLEEP